MFLKRSRIEILKDRASMLQKARSFFHQRHVFEVDCPLLSPCASVDAHIDLIPTHPVDGIRYLHSSPEYGMKRLLAEGIGDIYQLSHVFRNGECGPKHNPEFMMAEWYRMGMPFTDLIEETLNFIRLFLGDLPSTRITYREAFLKYADCDYLSVSNKELVQKIERIGISIPVEDAGDKDALLNLILGIFIEPHLGCQELCVLAYYPSSQAALAQTCYNGEEHVCERFEIYYKGVELANGYHELADAKEQRLRLEEANKLRLKLGKESLPIDENFLAALEQGLPDCCGVAVGFDRLMMLRHGVDQIADVMPFVWPNA